MGSDKEEIGRLVGLIEPNVNFGKLDTFESLELSLEITEEQKKDPIKEIDINRPKKKKNKDLF